MAGYIGMTRKPVDEPPPELRQQGACVGLDVELFFPSGERELETIRKGKAICRGCDLRAACLEWAMEHEAYGTWGGLSEWERRGVRIRRGLRRKLAS
jgi:WhiB family redox-sensing transcriptional regulator